MSTILITGANSFIGTNYIKSSSNNVKEEFCLIHNQPNEIDFSDVDVVLHVAGIVHQKESIPETTYFKVNTDLPIEVAKLAKKSGVKQFVFMSTVKVYGEFTDGMDVWNETTTCKPEDNYGKSKYQAEQELMKLNSENFVVSIVRTPLVYGKGVKANMASIVNLVKKLPVLPFKSIKNKRSFTYIENLVGFIDRIIELKASGIFIAKDDKDLSTTELVSLIAKSLNKKTILVKVPNFIISIGKKVVPKIFDRLYGSFEMENHQTLNTLNYKPPFTPEEGIYRMLNNNSN
jgi:nucleoside-diphosphate-sugar epimerase